MRRLGGLLGAVLVAVLLLVYAAMVLPVLPWWAWAVGLGGYWLIRRWIRARGAGLDAAQPTEGGPLWSPTGRGGL